MSQIFQIGITRDALNSEGDLARGDIGLSLLEKSEGVRWEFLGEDTKELRADQIQGYDALLVMGAQVTADTLKGADRLAIVARFGVGYDTVDVEACNRSGVVLTITPDGVRRPVASSALAFILALSHKLMIKDRLTRDGRWAERYDDMGIGLTWRVLGLVGLGNIGREIVRLAHPFEMRYLAYDPYVPPKEAASLTVEMVELETLLRISDFVCICCALTEETHHLISADRLSLMKNSSYLINVARGPIVDQKALTVALRERRIQGAALDVFEREPVDPQDPILTLDNVIVTPHTICMTDECALGCGKSAIKSILDVANGRIPRSVVNRSVLDSPRFQEKLRRFGARHGV